MVWPPQTHQDVQDAVTSLQFSAVASPTSGGNSLWNVGNIETLSRIGIFEQAITVGDLSLSYFYAPIGTTITKLGFQVGSTAGTGNTLARMALFTADTNDNLTKVAQTASDPTMASTAYLSATRALSTVGGYPASYTLAAGSRYALGFLIVGGTAPTMFSNNSSNQNTPPVMSRKMSAQTDISNTYTVGSLPTDYRCFYMFGLV